MKRLSIELYRRCRSILLKCSEFDTNGSLRAIFVTEELYPFRDRLPTAATNRSERVDKCLEFLLDKRLSDDRPVLPIFLTALSDRYHPSDALRDELKTLAKDIKSALISPSLGAEAASQAQEPESGPRPEFEGTSPSETRKEDNGDTILEPSRSVPPGLLPITISVIAATVLGLASNALANNWQLDTPQRFLVTVGIFFIALAIVLWAEYRRSSVPAAGASLLVTRISASIGALCLMIVIGWSIAMILSPFSDRTPSVIILQPTEGQKVTARTHVRGTASNLPDDSQVWVLVQNGTDGSFYFLPSQVEVDTAGIWETVAQVGTNSELEWHKPYTISMVLVDVNTSEILSEFLFNWPAGEEQGLIMPDKALILDNVGVVRVNPIVTLESHVSWAEVESRETLSGTYENLKPGDWHLYGIIEAEDGRQVPYGPFEPEDSKGEWAIDVEFPGPVDGTHSFSFHTLAVLTGTRSDKILRSSVGSLLNADDLPSEDQDNIYGPLTQIRLTPR